MSQYETLHQVVGKTVKGVVLRSNPADRLPAVSLFLAFSDDPCCESCSLHQLSIASLLARGATAHARASGTVPDGTMTNVLVIPAEDG